MRDLVEAAARILAAGITEVVGTFTVGDTIVVFMVEDTIVAMVSMEAVA